MEPLTTQNPTQHLVTTIQPVASSWVLSTDPRPGQVIALTHLDENPNSQCLVHVHPTGIGKTAIAVTAALHGESAYILSPNRIHVAQYAREFPDNLCKGRAAASHTCRPGAFAINCQETHEDEAEYCEGCPFVAERGRYIAGPVSVSTLDYFLARVMHPVKDQPMQRRKWLVIDECHRLEDTLLRYTGLTIPIKEATELGLHPFPVPAADPKRKKATTRRDIDGSLLIPYLRDIYLPIATSVVASLEAEVASAREAKKRGEDVPSLKKTSQKLARLRSRCEKAKLFLGLKPDEMVAWVEIDSDGEPLKLEFRPLSLAATFHKLFLPYAERVLLLSATIPSVRLLAKRLQIPNPAPGEHPVCRTTSPFPVENHDIRYRPVGSMALANRKETLPRLLKTVALILEKHKGQKGIIHTHTAELAKQIVDHVRSPRLILAVQSGEDVLDHGEAIAKHKASTEPTVLISPSMTDGVDLPGSDSEFQVICQVPYPYLGDPWIAAHQSAGADGRLWYAERTAATLTQAMGRSLRTPTDKCTTYILDEGFFSFFSQHGEIDPQDPGKLRLFPEPLRRQLSQAIVDNFDRRANKKLN